MYESLVGKTLNEVKAYAVENNLKARVSNIDGSPMVLTCDYDPSRMNLCVENNIVTEIIVG